ncbi:MAG: hypothetical protein SWX82_22375 [Cyanobacteriota bacterium]|nr:hypothetical protein [Cyanobacteriota bacterium]
MSFSQIPYFPSWEGLGVGSPRSGLGVGSPRSGLGVGSPRSGLGVGLLLTCRLADLQTSLSPYLKSV